MVAQYPAPFAHAVPAPVVEYTYDVVVRRHYDLPNNDAIVTVGEKATRASIPRWQCGKPTSTARIPARERRPGRALARRRRRRLAHPEPDGGGSLRPTRCAPSWRTKVFRTCVRQSSVRPR
ncbi:hypothetical protein EAH80_19675 [Mycobacterium hodleri]|uniref:Uncharacterized protein n=1 Tax=Mycolicibacterium hodleri TaxID=49897 RepID=A0A502E6A1_9MYCO|nr:hypothetical protein EAH80_19675 [Mycolicibacterium hodleri]